VKPEIIVIIVVTLERRFYIVKARGTGYTIPSTSCTQVVNETEDTDDNIDSQHWTLLMNWKVVKRRLVHKPAKLPRSDDE